MPVRRASLPGIFVGLCLLVTPAVLADVCELSTKPAATLLFPYFEVDLADAQGRTTLISINNVAEEATVARVTLWTNAGSPTLGFDLVLDPRDVQSLNLRNLLAGQIPSTDIDTALPGCSDPLVLPEADGQDLAAWHSGAADSQGLCRGVAGEEPELAIGYVTVDVMNQCSPFFTYPGDPAVHAGGVRYFEDGGLGLASNENRLWGDLILIDDAGDAAQSVAAVHIRADADQLAGSVKTFYGAGADNRAPLPSTYRGRFLSGQPAGTETSFLMWLDPISAGFLPLEGVPCGEAASFTNPCRLLQAQAYDEAGNAFGDEFLENGSQVLRQLQISPAAGAGFIEARFQELVACVLLPSIVEPRQAVMIPLLRAEGRFSAATAAVALDSTCTVVTP